jgi:hypothetical protein
MGIGDALRTGAGVLVANLSLSKKAKKLREMKGVVPVSMLWDQALASRNRREHRFDRYQSFRDFLDTYGPDRVVARDQINTRWCDPNEWELYLKPGTGFDITCRTYFEVFPRMEMLIITHKSDKNKLKRIEATPQGEKMRIIWSEA